MLELKNISWEIPDGDKILKGIDLEIPDGKMTLGVPSLFCSW